MKRINQRAYRRRAVAMYAATLLTSMLLTGAAITLATVQMTSRRLQRNIGRPEQTSLLAQAALERALWSVDADSSWRKANTSGVTEKTNVTGLGSITTTYTDEDDGDLGDNDCDQVTVTVSATGNDVTQTLTALATPEPHPALRYALFAAADLTMQGDLTIAGPVHSNTDIVALTAIGVEDDGSFQVVSGGSIQAGLAPTEYAAEEIPLPGPSLSFYTNQATKILAGPGSPVFLDGLNLTPTHNSRGKLNPKGIYWVDAGSRNVHFGWLHLKGTLIVTVDAGYQVFFDRPCWIEPGESGYPTLLLSAPGGDVVINLPGTGLDEADTSVDYNEDGDDVDVFEETVKGLVWADTDDVWLAGSWSFKGSLIGEEFHVVGTSVIDSDPELAGQLIPGFTDGSLHLVRGSVREILP